MSRRSHTESCFDLIGSVILLPAVGRASQGISEGKRQPGITTACFYRRLQKVHNARLKLRQRDKKENYKVRTVSKEMKRNLSEEPKHSEKLFPAEETVGISRHVLFFESFLLSQPAVGLRVSSASWEQTSQMGGVFLMSTFPIG